jgi:hypothetical protein
MRRVVKMIAKGPRKSASRCAVTMYGKGYTDLLCSKDGECGNAIDSGKLV